MMRVALYALYKRLTFCGVRIVTLAEGAARARTVSSESVFEKGHGHRLTRVAEAAMVTRVSATEASCS